MRDLKKVGSVWKFRGDRLFVITYVSGTEIFDNHNVYRCIEHERHTEKYFDRNSSMDLSSIEIPPEQITNELLQLETPPTKKFMEALEQAR